MNSQRKTPVPPNNDKLQPSQLTQYMQHIGRPLAQYQICSSFRRQIARNQRYLHRSNRINMTMLEELMRQS
jgi:hypothetical protein